LSLEQQDIVAFGIVKHGPRNLTGAVLAPEGNETLSADSLHSGLKIGYFQEHNRFVVRGVGLGCLPLQADKRRTALELGMMTDRLACKLKAQR
jgi:hypothetical protein